MTEKTKILDHLGEQALLLPSKVNAALAANDRVKYLFALLQSALDHARHPVTGFNDLATERRAAGVTDTRLDEVVAGARDVGHSMYTVPNAELIHDSVVAALDEMLAPLELDDAGNGFRERLTALLEALPEISGDQVPGDYVAALTHGDRARGDSPHLLVMDAHKALNRLQAGISEETIDGAKVYQLTDADKTLVSAFMKGLNRTAPLKFGHPGLATTATRSGNRLLLQNDIGTTDAHVLVVTVEGLAVTITYTDIHPERLRFFESLFSAFPVAWSHNTVYGLEGFEKSSYQLDTGVYTAPTPAELDQYLAFLGSRLVYLIDWNKARKRLRIFVKKREAVEILKWAANHDYGHRGFLALGGEHLVFEAVEYAAGPDVHYGERLDELLGFDHAAEYLRFVLRTSSEGLSSGRSDRIIKDEINAELLRYFQSAREGLLSVASEHAAYIHELANGVRDGLVRINQPEGRAILKRLAQRARKWEKRADDLTNRGRVLMRNIKGPGAVPMVMDQADDAADDLEEAAFILMLVPDAMPPDELLIPLRRLSDEAEISAREYVRCLESATSLHRGGEHEETADFLAAVDGISQAEHRADEIVRDITAGLVHHAENYRELHLVSELSRLVEGATDDLARSAFILRDYVLNEVLNR